MKRTRWLVLSLACLLAGALIAAAQQAAPAPAEGPAKEVLRMWNSTHNRIVEMAEDFPEDKYDYRPTPEVRTFAEQILHIAGTNDFFIKSAQGQPATEEDLPRSKYRTKAEVVAALKKSVEEGAALIQQTGDEGIMKPIKFPFANRMVSRYYFWMDAVEHSGEHYGNLVVYYRVNGLVPPASRPRKQ
ncbi:MAG: DinB family protein [Candidatus Acidiferrales bacterium]